MSRFVNSLAGIFGRSVKIFIKDTRKRLPEAHLTLWTSGAGTSTVSLTGIGRGTVVDIAGEFEKAAWYKGKSPIMDAALVINPRQPIYWALVVTYGMMSLLFIGGGIAFFVVYGKSPKKPNGCADS